MAAERRRTAAPAEAGQASGDYEDVPLRIHFTVGDLARTRIADGPAPCIELSTAARQLQERTHTVRFGAWRHRTLSALHPASRMVFALMPSRGRITDFLSGTNGATPAELLEQIRSTSRSRLRASLEHTAQHQPCLHGPTGCPTTRCYCSSCATAWSTWPATPSSLIGSRSRP